MATTNRPGGSCLGNFQVTGLSTNVNSVTPINFFPTDSRPFSFQYSLGQIPADCVGQTYKFSIDAEKSSTGCGSITLAENLSGTVSCADKSISVFNDNTVYAVSVSSNDGTTYDFNSAAFRAFKKAEDPTVCAASATFPDHQDSVTYPTTDSDPISIAIKYSPYECAMSYGTNGNFASTGSGPSFATSFFTFAGSADAQWFETATVTTTVQGTTKGSIPAGQYQAKFSLTGSQVLSDAPVTISHDNTSPAPPTASQKHKKREQLVAQAVILERPDDLNCGPGYNACPVPGVGWECAVANVDVDSCGGCLSTHTDVDCTSIAGAAELSCVQGTCEIFSCDKNHVHINSTYCEPPTARLGRIVAAFAIRD